MPFLTEGEAAELKRHLLESARDAATIYKDLHAGAYSENKNNLMKNSIAAVNARQSAAGKLLVAEALFTEGTAAAARASIKAQAHIKGLPSGGNA